MGFLSSCFGVLIDIISDEAKAAGVSVAKDQLARIRFNDALPKNAHIRYAIADSHVRALRRLIEQYEAYLDQQVFLPASDRADAVEIERGRAFCHAARKVIGRNSMIYLDPAAIAATFSEDQAHNVFDTLMGPGFLDERQEVSDSWIRDAAWTRLLTSMDYGEDMAPPVFRQMFMAGEGGYMANFAHCFRDRLKDPKNTEVFQITTALGIGQIRELLSGKWDAIEASLREQDRLRDQLLTRLSLGAQRVLTRPRLDRLEDSDHPSAGFRYERAFDDLVGREAELFDMETGFLAPVEPGDRNGMFRWQGLCGDAGSGKSRFCMELLDRVADYWPAGGFLNLSSATTDLSWLDALDRPSLIVIDYAGGKANVTDLLKTLANLARSRQLRAPVRVLLVERRPDDPLFTRLFDIEALRDAGPGSQDGMVELRQIEDASILRLMRGRLGERSCAFTDEKLLEHLADFDERKRPLFAAIVAAFLKTESLPQIDRDASAEQARWSLFWGLIRVWRKEVWSAGDTKQDTGPYELVAALATFVKGLPATDHKRLCESGQTGILPPAEGRTFEYLGRILGPLQDLGRGDYLYPAMEPDLAGECFVLGQWAEPNGNDGMRLKLLAYEQAEAMASLAWRLSPWKAADFARRCYQSYPSAAVAVNYLIPDKVEARALLPKSMAVSSIIAEYVTRHRAKAEQQRDMRSEAPSIPEQQEILGLYGLFDADIVAAAATDIEIARTLAVSTRQVVNFLAQAINDRMSWVDNPFAQKLEAIAEGRIEEHASANRDVFNTGAQGAARVLH